MASDWDQCDHCGKLVLTAELNEEGICPTCAADDSVPRFTSPLVDCERCGLHYEYWQLEPCLRCGRRCCVSCLHADTKHPGPVTGDVAWYCLECYELVTA